ncbi:MAG TPA: T9SS type A sorting domain-containing protein [Edaphocola sp.]|nr:T9SS type A sorting domain-containing protein [Edaphocola sp.]
MKKILYMLIIVCYLPFCNVAQGFDTTYNFGPTNPYWGKGSRVSNILADSNMILFSGYCRRDSIDLNLWTGLMPMVGAIDYQGNLLWWKGLSLDTPKYYAGDQIYYQLLSKINTNKYVMIASGSDGITLADSMILIYPYLLIFNSQGDTIHLSPIPTYNDSLEYPPTLWIRGLCVDNNKNILVTGRYYNVLNPTSLDSGGLYIAKFDSNGVFQWKKHYYSLFGNIIDPAYGGFKILPANEGNGFLISSYKATMDTLTKSIFHFIRIDSVGNILWEKTLPKANTLFRFGDNFERADFINAKDGNGYYFNSREYADTSNMYFRFMSYIGKIDNIGNVVWAKTIDFNGINVTPNDMLQMDNGDLVFNIEINDPISTGLNNFSGTTLLCTDSLGNIKWHKAYRTIFCAPIDEPMIVMSKTPYNSIALGGYEGNLYAPFPNCYTSIDFVSRVALVDSLGRRNNDDTAYLYFNPTVTEVEYPTGITPPAKDLKKTINVYPNPAGQDLFISIKEKGNYKIEIQDINGRSRMNKNLGADITQIDIANWQAGIYFIKVFENNTYLGAFKFVKQ